MNTTNTRKAQGGVSAPTPSDGSTSVNAKDSSAVPAKAKESTPGEKSQRCTRQYYLPSALRHIFSRMATIVDPRGAAFSLMKARSGDPVPAPPKRGEFCWEQLGSNDLSNAREFYAEVVGWKTMGLGGGDFETFGFGHLPAEQAAS